MTEQPESGRVPEWDTADRMRKALRESGIGVQDMADYLAVDRSTVSTWINGRIAPSVQTMRLWALRCGVSFEWLAGTPEPRRRERIRIPAVTGPNLKLHDTADFTQSDLRIRLAVAA